MPRIGRVLIVACVFAFTLVPQFASAQLGGLFGGGGKDFALHRDPGGRFQLDYPKDWQRTAIGAGDVLVTFTEKKGEAAVFIQRHQLLDDPGDITSIFGQFEVDSLKMQQPQAAGVSFKIAAASNGRSVVIIDYSRQGLAGPEQGRQYSFPVGREVYRLNCTAKMSVFAKYEQQFLRIAESFTPASSAQATPAAGQPAAK